MRLRHLCLAGVLGISLVLGGCTRIPNQAWAPIHQPLAVKEGTSHYMVLEIDEAGPVFNAEQYQRMQTWLETDSPESPVVIFINGWHHNAQPEDSNLLDFQGFLKTVETKAGGEAISGIYLGWRGDSYDTFVDIEATDFWTIYGRKKAARAVGKGGVRDVLAYLKARHPDRRVYVVGHSLGGAALFEAIKDTLPEEVNDRFEYILLNPAVSEGELRDVEQKYNFSRPVQLDAVEFALMRSALARAHRKMTVLQSLGDKPIKYVYRLAFLSDAIGFDKSRISHKAYVCESQSDCPRNNEPACYVTLADGQFMIEAIPSETQGCREINAGSIWVIAGADSVSANHNDILNSIQANALADLLGRRITALP